MQFFNVTADTTVRDIRFVGEDYYPYAPQDQEHIGKVTLEEMVVGGPTLAQIQEITGKEHIILCMGTPGTEPVNHLMKEIAAKKSEYEVWNGAIIFVMKEDKWKSEPNQPKNLMVAEGGYDELVDIFKKALEL